MAVHTPVITQPMGPAKTPMVRVSVALAATEAAPQHLPGHRVGDDDGHPVGHEAGQPHSDAVPYLRLHWRLSFVTVCPIHQRLLLDRCPACNEPFSVLRMECVHDMRCPSCATDLRHFMADTPPVDVVPVQQDLQRVVGQGWWALGTHGPVYSFAALEILVVLARLLSGGPHAHPLRAWVGEQAPGLAVPPEAVPRARDGALLPPKARSVVVAMAHWLMGEWPKELVGRVYAMSEGLTGETCKLLALAAETAIHSGREIIDMVTLEHVPWVMPSERRRSAR